MTCATAVFSQPEIGTVGLSEDDAARKLGNLDIYRAAFRPMRNILPGREERMIMKLVVDADTRPRARRPVLGTRCRRDGAASRHRRSRAG